VRSQHFSIHQAVGDPPPTIKRLSDWDVDELILLNISSNEQLDSRRDDKWHNLGSSTFHKLLQEVARFSHMPITVGGNIRSIKQVDKLFAAGADKICLNTTLFTDPDFVRTCSQKYGCQSIVGSVDFKLDASGKTLHSYVQRGTVSTNLGFYDSIENVLALPIGELLISSIDNDGCTTGFSPQVLSCIDSHPSIGVPLILNSGATQAFHFSTALANPSVDAVAAGNIFYYTENSYPNLKASLLKSKPTLPIRPSSLNNPFLQREPSYDHERRSSLFAKEQPHSYFDESRYSSEVKDIRFCTRCLYPSLSASPMQFDDKGVCMGCKVSDAKLAISEQDYSHRLSILSKTISTILSDTPNKTYDCIVSVSGGKDSYYQVHYVQKILGLKPLLVTYNGNNYTEVGWKNLHNMRFVFDCDHIIFSPSVSVLKKLNRAAFVAMGDMNWHAHVGIYTTAPRIAVQMNIPIIFWGEHGYADLSGQFSMDDYPEMNYRERLEHAGRGFEWNFFDGIYGLTSQDLHPWKYPSDSRIHDLRLRQFYLGHYIPWESNKHLSLVKDLYGFETSATPFERTYRVGSNLDDMHENGIHDYLKYIKFGYGRCTDHASKDIRAGILDRDKGCQLVNQYDHILPSDLYRWLDYVQLSEDDFHRIADFFRDPRVWSLTNGHWVRKTLQDR